MSRIVTYSPAYTIVPTYECFNRCLYCNFRVDVGKASWLEIETARKILTSLKGVTEILILSGEIHPLSPQRHLWFQRIYDLASLALSSGFFPHTNAGVLSYEEMSRLKQVNFSLGLMLEQVVSLDVHKYAPTKKPELRIQQLQWAGSLKIPFTTGILLGLGETIQDCYDSLRVIASIHQKWGHIQEVIIQPYQPGKQEIYKGKPVGKEEILEVVAMARKILPPDVTIQLPPNLISDKQLLLEALQLGVRDLGGIVAKDEVNPDYPHEDITFLKNFLRENGWQLKPRLPVYPQYYSWLPPHLQMLIQDFLSQHQDYIRHPPTS